MKTLIKEIVGINSQGVSFNLTERAQLNGGLNTKKFNVSWDTIGKALFRGQYSDAESVKVLNSDRGNIEPLIEE